MTDCGSEKGPSVNLDGPLSNASYRRPVVRFDDQRRGRLNVIRHLVESVPYREVTDAPVVLAALDGAPATERFAGPVKPIRGW